MERSSAGGDTGKFRCLVADDSAFARRTFANIVEKAGGTIVGEAADGQEAVELYVTLRPDLVVMDISMPRVDGVEALRLILNRDRSAKVIIISSLGHKEMVWKAICLGAKSYVTKPCNPDHARSVIRDVVAGRSKA